MDKQVAIRTVCRNKTREEKGKVELTDKNEQTDELKRKKEKSRQKVEMNMERQMEQRDKNELDLMFELENEMSWI